MICNGDIHDRVKFDGGYKRAAVSRIPPSSSSSENYGEET